MTSILGIIAATIFFFYAFYFIKIIKANPQGFEIHILKSLTYSMAKTGELIKNQLWTMYFAALLLEIGYFFLTFYLIDNLAMQVYTAALAGVELAHYINMAGNFKRFFSGQSSIVELFNWRMERISAVLFFTHSLLVLIVLFAF